jgi:hypothetical protein
VTAPHPALVGELGRLSYDAIVAQYAPTPRPAPSAPLQASGGETATR